MTIQAVPACRCIDTRPSGAEAGPATDVTVEAFTQFQRFPAQSGAQAIQTSRSMGTGNGSRPEALVTAKGLPAAGAGRIGHGHQPGIKPGWFIAIVFVIFVVVEHRLDFNAHGRPIYAIEHF